MVDFDYVIVGTGTAGCVLASQPSEDPRNRVLALEYGGHDTNPVLYVPEGSIPMSQDIAAHAPKTAVWRQRQHTVPGRRDLSRQEETSP